MRRSLRFLLVRSGEPLICCALWKYFDVLDSSRCNDVACTLDAGRSRQLDAHASRAAQADTQYRCVARRACVQCRCGMCVCGAGLEAHVHVVDHAAS